ncbi:MAG: hypothetical protein AAGF58_02920 [Pseudomonadota bacterium]
MLGRSVVGVGAVGLYGWRVADPKTSYGFFFDVSDWLTSWVVQGEGAMTLLRNMINLVLVEQAEGFLLGMAVVALFSVMLWPFRAAGRYTVRRAAKVMGRERRDA